jgi:hypothetical protein
VTKQTRQIYSLVGLLAVLGAVVTYELSPAGPTTGGAAPSNSSKAAAAAGTLQVAEVNLDRLHEGSEALGAVKRDPFRFKPKPPPPPPPRPPAPPPLPVQQTVARPPGPPPDTRPEIPMKYFGYVMSTNGTRIAQLSDGNPNHPPMLGKQGDIIDGRYRLLRVDAGEIEMSYLDGGKRRRIVKGQ